MGFVTIVTPPCMLCNQTENVKVSKDAYNKFMNGMFVHEAFPDFSNEDRELILTGTHPKCWNEMFSNK